MTETEISRQQQRIQQYKDDPERDEHDVKKQAASLPQAQTSIGAPGFHMTPSVAKRARPHRKRFSPSMLRGARMKRTGSGHSKPS